MAGTACFSALEGHFGPNLLAERTLRLTIVCITAPNLSPCRLMLLYLYEYMQVVELLTCMAETILSGSVGNLLHLP